MHAVTELWGHSYLKTITTFVAEESIVKTSDYVSVSVKYGEPIPLARTLESLTILVT